MKKCDQFRNDEYFVDQSFVYQRSDNYDK